MTGSRVSQVALLVDHVHNLGADFTIPIKIDGLYDHILATLADAALQANRKYKQVVLPRVQRILRLYPEVRTAQAADLLLQSVPISEVLDYRGQDRAERLRGVLDLLIDEGINTEENFKNWLTIEGSRDKLLDVRGIGPKTADYFPILVGLSNAAPDIHLYEFLRDAGVSWKNYADAKEIIHGAADDLGIDRAYFDHAIWLRKSRSNETAPRPRSDGGWCDRPSPPS